MNKTKTIKTLIVVIICSLITFGATIGICFYNYYGYVEYKKHFLEYYFGQTEDASFTNQQKIENAVKWETSYYTNQLNITYRDPSSKEIISKNKISNDKATNVNAYFENNVLHLPKYFDIEVYQQLTISTNEETGETKATNSFNFYFSNIDYNNEKDFSPEYIYMTFVEGIGEESDEALDEALNAMDSEGISTGNISTIYSYALLGEEGDTLETYSIYDTARNVFAEEDDYYYIFKNRCAKSYDNKTTFGTVKEQTFCVYYMDDSEEGSKELKRIVEGTFIPLENSEGNIISNDEFAELEFVSKGYNKNYYQADYKEFITPKIITSGLITFGVAGILSALLALVWLYDPTKVTNKKGKKNKK